MTCTTCGTEIESGQQAMFGIVRPDGVWMFGWTCCHQPVGDVAVILGSQFCADAWLEEHRQHRAALLELGDTADHAHA